MKLVDSIAALREQVSSWKAAGYRVAVVPTMGNLHRGHLALVEEARERADKVVATIFVNPTQFGEGEDFASYPRTIDEDLKKLADCQTDCVFTPEIKEIYTGKISAGLTAPEHLANILCGENRPRHFDGVVTVVKKLFEIVEPTVAAFGKKDFQQLQIIKWLAAPMKIEIIAGETMREENGLAMSSRNQYLTEQERASASQLRRSLLDIRKKCLTGETNFTHLCANTKSHLTTADFTVDYVEIRDAKTLSNTTINQPVAFIAARLGNTRLIDNIECA
jgi:pantoate--beta-alanine ligase